MAERRMFAKTIIDSDAFIDMPVTARLLYYDLAMRADDDGFVNSPKKIMRMIGASQDDLSILIMRKFIIPFDSGIVVIKHWRIHNYIRNDRYKPTEYAEEKSRLTIKDNGAYTLDANGIPSGNKLDTNGIPMVDQMDTQDRLGKDRLGKDRLEEIAPPKPKRTRRGEYNHVLLTDEEYQKLQKEYGNADELIRFLDEYKEMKGYKCKNDYLAIKKWVVDAVKEHGSRKNNKVVPMPEIFTETPAEKTLTADESAEQIRKIRELQQRF